VQVSSGEQMQKVIISLRR